MCRLRQLGSLLLLHQVSPCRPVAAPGDAAVDATYVGATFEYTVLADERMGGVVTTWVNPATRSTASFESRIDPTSLPDDPEAAEAAEWTDGSAAAWPLAVAAARAHRARD